MDKPAEGDPSPDYQDLQITGSSPGELELHRHRLLGHWYARLIKALLHGLLFDTVRR
jgi:hypothetical protein